MKKLLFLFLIPILLGESSAQSTSSEQKYTDFKTIFSEAKISNTNVVVYLGEVVAHYKSVGYMTLPYHLDRFVSENQDKTSTNYTETELGEKLVVGAYITSTTNFYLTRHDKLLLQGLDQFAICGSVVKILETGVVISSSQIVGDDKHLSYTKSSDINKNFFIPYEKITTVHY